jgi:hypothetical protein
VEGNNIFDKNIANRKTGSGDTNLNDSNDRITNYSKSALSSSSPSSSTPDSLFPRLLTAKEFSEATDDSYIGSLVQNGIRGTSIIDCYTCLMKDKIEGLRTLKGKIKDQAVIVKIIIPNSDAKDGTTVSHSLQFLRELRVLCELSHPNILPLYGYTFNPLARIFKIPIYPNKTDCQESFTAIQADDYTDRSNLLSLYFVLFEKRQGFTWKKRIRVVICILQALIYLLGDIDPGRSCIIHRYAWLYNCAMLLIFFMSYLNFHSQFISLLFRSRSKKSMELLNF